MKTKCAVLALVIAVSACAPVRMVGDAAATAGQVALGAADLVL